MKIINSHLGGGLPMLIQRMDDQYHWEAPETPERPSVAAKRMWYEHPPALRCACERLGSDFPYETGDLFQCAVDYINQSGLAEQDAQRILDTNAPPLLGLEPT